jgi:hypothetical protein
LSQGVIAVISGVAVGVGDAGGLAVVVVGVGGRPIAGAAPAARSTGVGGGDEVVLPVVQVQGDVPSGVDGFDQVVTLVVLVAGGVAQGVGDGGGVTERGAFTVLIVQGGGPLV